MSPMNSHPVTYDSFGRMRYHPDFHANQGTPWTTTDEKYLIENYETQGPEQVSLALERTIHTVMQRATQLRKAGRMPLPKTKAYHKRLYRVISGGKGTSQATGRAQGTQ